MLYSKKIYFALIFVFIQYNTIRAQEADLPVYPDSTGIEIIPDSILIATQQFDQLRRIIIDAPINLNSSNYSITRMPDKGRCVIKIVPVDSNLYAGNLLIKDGGKTPIKLQISFQDSSCLMIVIESLPYADLIAYDIIGSRKTYIDIIRDESLPYPLGFMNDDYTNDSDVLFAESTEQAGSVDGFINNRITTPPTVPKKISNGGYINRINFARAISLAGWIFTGLICAGIVYLLIRQFKSASGLSVLLNRIRRSVPYTTPEEKVLIEVSPKTAITKDERIRRIMTNRKISYDEAAIMDSMQNKGGFNAEA